MLKIPSKLIITKLNPDVLTYCKEKKINLDYDYDCLIEFLLTEESKGINSFFSSYFQSLPKDFSSFPVFYTDKEMALLEGSCFLKRLEDLKLQIDDCFTRVRTNSSSSKNFDKFLNMYLVLQSRSFGLDTSEDTYDALVPFGDMFNTSLEDKPCFWYFDEENNFHVEASREINKDENLFINYNDGHNSDFLLYYGFTLPNNPNGHIYEFPIIIKNKSDILCINIELNIKPSIRHYKLDLLRKHFNNLNEKRERIELKCLNLIKEHIVESLKLYPTSLKEDKENLRKIENQNDYSLINIYRVLVEEKTVLESNLRFLKCLINAIKSGNYDKNSYIFSLSHMDEEYIKSLKLI